MSVSLNPHIITLKSKYPFKITHGTRTETKTFILEIVTPYGTGHGEATPVPYYGVTPEEMSELLFQHQQLIIDNLHLHPAELWKKLNPAIGHNHFLQCAIDIAAYDLWAKKKGKTVYQMLGLDIQNIPDSNYTIGIDETPKMIEKLKEYDFPIYKIKLGTADDIAIVKALRKETDAIFRVDANTAWTVEQTIEYSGQLQKLGVEFIEQPLKAEEYEAMIEVKKHSKLPIFADESCIVEEDVKKCIAGFHGINIKLAKCGGITPALRMIQEARANNLKVMMGCMTESSIGISAIAQLLPLLDYADMDGTLLISNDPANGVYLDKGKVRYPDKPGIGASLN